MRIGDEIVLLLRESISTDIEHKLDYKQPASHLKPIARTPTKYTVVARLGFEPR